MGWLSNLLLVIGKALGIVENRDAQKNTPAMKANKVAEREAAERAEVNQHLQDEDADKLRKDIS